MTSIRLSADVEKKIEKISRTEKTTKSEIIKTALKEYFDSYDKKSTPYDLGKNIFGKYGSGKGDLAKNRKKILKEKISDKISH